MAYVRKTSDEWQIQGNYGQGWEEVCAEETYRDAREQLKCYRENEPQYPHRIRCKRVRKVIRLLECGCCGQFHPEGSFLPGGSANYLNDCRNDANRFNSDEDFKERTGLECVEVPLDEQEVA